jgi:hypothetical protein
MGDSRLALRNIKKIKESDISFLTEGSKEDFVDKAHEVNHSISL